MATFAMVEFPSADASASAAFFERVFGWPGAAFGPDYVDVPMPGGGSLGFQADPAERPTAPLVVIEVDDLAAARATVLAAGGVVTVEPFSFPGGSRMHVREPGGNEVGLYVPGP